MQRLTRRCVRNSETVILTVRRSGEWRVRRYLHLALFGNQSGIEPAGSSLGFIRRWAEHSAVGIVIRDEDAHARRRPRRWERSKRPPYMI